MCVWAEATGLLPRLAALPAHAAAGSINVCVCVCAGGSAHACFDQTGVCDVRPPLLC